MNKDQAKEEIKKLIAKYEQVKASGKIKSYTEEETKNAFIKPLFEILGWDFSEKDEVSAEEFIISSGRVDYGFYINNRPKFYLEAKPLKADLNLEEFAKQAIRYSFNRGVTWAILTDFEGIKVFNAQALSNYLGDKLYFELSYSEYLSHFDKLWELSKESFQSDLIDKNAQEAGKKLPKTPITELLYKDLNECRKILTDQLGKWNPGVPQHLLDEGVQKLLDRIVFIKVAEDRKIENNVFLPLINQWRLLTGPNKPTLYQSMTKKFRELDSIYNSSLFSPHPFEKWEEEGEALEKVLKILNGKEGYYEYDFSIMPADILGTVYENYLGYKLSQSAKGLKLHKDAEKRKEQGIYYTPTSIVDYIVRNTLKPVLDNCKSVDELKKIRVLDPACGSGSFLIKALEVIVEKYKDFSVDVNDFTKFEILQENIYGVDLDQQAVEIAKLNLLINSFGQREILPSLDHNIKNGNSLISGEDKEMEKYFGKDFKNKKPFNWQEEFPEVFSQGGFDVIIGNPPYVFTRGNFDDSEKKYYSDIYEQTEFKINTYVLFIEKSFNILNKEGVIGFIIPNNWLTLETASRFRKFILEKTSNVQIINIKDKVFGAASVDNCILSFNKLGEQSVSILEMTLNNIQNIVNFSSTEILNKPGFLITYADQNHGEHSELCKRILTNTFPLDYFAEVKNGVQAYTVGEGTPTQTKEIKENRAYHSLEKIDDTWIKYVDGVDVHRNYLGWSRQYIKYGKNLSRPRRFDLFNRKRILVRQIPSKPPYSIFAAYTEETLINDNNSMIIKVKPEHEDTSIIYILGLLNSKLMSFWFNYTFGKLQRKIFPQFKINELSQFPIYNPSKDQQELIINLVDKIIDLNNKLRSNEEGSDNFNSIKAEIEKTDKKIDEEVYKLYGLAPEEIKIVENS